MRSILALAATMAVLVGGGVAVASPTGSTSKAPAGKAGTAPAAKKTPMRAKAPHRCHNSDGLSSYTSPDL
jgi:hypothetical protein